MQKIKQKTYDILERELQEPQDVSEVQVSSSASVQKKVDQKKSLPQVSEKQNNKSVNLSYLSHAIVLEESETPKLMRRATQMVTASLVGFLIWAGLTPVNEIAKGNGEVVPSGQVQEVQHYEGGIIEEILVEEGQFIEKDQVLVRLNATGAESDLESLRVKGVGLLIEGERLRAYINDNKPNYIAYEDNYPELVQNQRDLLVRQKDNQKKKEMILDDEIKEGRSKLSGLKKQVSSVKDQVNIANEEYYINDRLYKKGHNSRIAMLESKKILSEKKERLSSLEAESKVTINSIEKAKKKKKQLGSELKQEALEKADSIDRDYSSLIEKIQKLEDRTDRTEIRSPARGIVKGLSTGTIGAVVAPGENILEVVPVGMELIVETKLGTENIGHVSIGQEVNIKVDSYDFGRYGAIKGKLEKISATTFKDKKTNKPYYKAVVNLSQNYAGHQADKNPILPGMTVQTDVVTGQKSILAYLFKPVALAADEAFSER